MDTEKLRGLKPGATVAMTGGRGLVASRIRDRLAETYRLRLLDLYPADEPGLRVEAVDLTDFAATARSLDGVDGVIHLAIASRRALTHLDPHAYAEAEIRANVLGTRHLFEAAAEAGVKRMVYASSVTVHLGEPRTQATATGDPLRPLNHYAITKFYGEQVAWWYANAGRLSTVCWRLGQPYPVDFFGLSHLDKPENRTLAVTSRDLAAGFAAGLTADLSQDDWPDADRDRSAGHLRPIAGFALGHLVSASDVPAPTGYDLTVSARLGYEPRDRMTSRGPVPRGGDGGGG